MVIDFFYEISVSTLFYAAIIHLFFIAFIESKFAVEFSLLLHFKFCLSQQFLIILQNFSALQCATEC
jgi:hypothetical protein